MKKISPFLPPRFSILLQRSLWLLVGLVALGQLQRFELLPGVAVYGHDVFIVGWLVLVLSLSWEFLFEKLDGLWRHRFSGWQYLFMATVVWGVLLTLYTSWQQQSLIPLLYLLRLTTYASFAASLQLLKPNTTLQLQQLVVALLVGLLGILQFVLLPDIRFLFILGWDDHYYRLVSTLLDPAFTGALLLLGLLFSFTLPQKNSLPPWVLIVFRTVLLVAMLLTFSRATYLAGLVGGGYLILKTNKRVPIKSVILLASVVLLLSAGLYLTLGGEGTRLWRTSTVSARLSNTQAYLQQTNASSLLVGQGWFSSAATQNTSGELPNHATVPDNFFVLLIVSLGIPGAIAFVVSLWMCAIPVFKGKPALQALVLALLIHTQFSNTLLQPFIWLYFGWGLAVTEKLQAQGD